MFPLVGVKSGAIKEFFGGGKAEGENAAGQGNASSSPGKGGQSPPTEKPHDAAPSEGSDEDEEAEQALFDELFQTPVYQQEEFEERLKTLNEEQAARFRRLQGFAGVIPKRHRARRWQVFLWDLFLTIPAPSAAAAKEGKLSDLFLEIDVGGRREEMRVQSGAKHRIFAIGDVYARLRTKVAYSVRGGVRVPLHFRTSLEYIGSYEDLEREKLCFRMWKFRRWRMNQLEGIFELPLHSIATGALQRSVEVFKPVKGRKARTATLEFCMSLQEIYDFELGFYDWRIFDFRTFREISRDMATLAGERATRSGTPNSSEYRSAAAPGSLGFEPTAGRVSASPATAGWMDWWPWAGGGGSKPHLPAYYRHCQVAINLRIEPDAGANDDASVVRSAVLPDCVTPVWETVGTAFFRGTIRDLESAALTIEAIDFVAPRGCRTVAIARIPLRGVIDYAFLRAPLAAPLWLRSATKNDKNPPWATLPNFGTIEGKVHLSNVPEFRQTGVVSSVDRKRFNLIVKVEQIDLICTPDGRKDLRSHVQLSVGSQVASSKTVPGFSRVQFNETLIVPLGGVERTSIGLWDMNSLPPIRLDVWSERAAYQEHCGGFSFSVRDIYLTPRGGRKLSERVSFEDNLTGEKFTCVTPILSGKFALEFCFNADRAAHVTLSAWTWPDLSSQLPVQTLSPVLPSLLAPSLEARLADFERSYEEVLKVERGKMKQRTYFLYAVNQRGSPLFLPSLIGRVVPPRFVDTPAAIFHFVRCVRFSLPGRSAAMNQLPPAGERWGAFSSDHFLTRFVACSPDFTLEARNGSVLDHVLLHVSLLLGLSVPAYLCTGTLANGAPHFWAASFHWDHEKQHGYVQFWESTTGQVFILRRRFEDSRTVLKLLEATDAKRTAPADRRAAALENPLGGNFLTRLRRKTILKRNTASVTDFDVSDDARFFNDDVEAGSLPPAPRNMPYRSLDFIANHQNVWVNLQAPDPGSVYFDLWRDHRWYRFNEMHAGVRSSFWPRGFGGVAHESTVRQYQLDLYERLYSSVPTFRSSRNLSTRLNKNPQLQLFLEKGLRLLHQTEIAGADDAALAKARYRDWRRALVSRLPPLYKVVGNAYQFNDPDSKFICDAVLDQCPLLQDRDRTACFAVGAYVKGLPGPLTAVYVLILLVARISSSERRQQRQSIVKDRRDKLLRARLKKKRRDRPLAKQSASSAAQDAAAATGGATPADLDPCAPGPLRQKSGIAEDGKRGGVSFVDLAEERQGAAAAAGAAAADMNSVGGTGEAGPGPAAAVLGQVPPGPGPLIGGPARGDDKTAPVRRRSSKRLARVPTGSRAENAPALAGSAAPAPETGYTRPVRDMAVKKLTVIEVEQAPGTVPESQGRAMARGPDALEAYLDSVERVLAELLGVLRKQVCAYSISDKGNLFAAVGRLKGAAAAVANANAQIANADSRTMKLLGAGCRLRIFSSGPAAARAPSQTTGVAALDLSQPALAAEVTSVPSPRLAVGETGALGVAVAGRPEKKKKAAVKTKKSKQKAASELTTEGGPSRRRSDSGASESPLLKSPSRPVVPSAAGGAAAVSPRAEPPKTVPAASAMPAPGDGSPPSPSPASPLLATLPQESMNKLSSEAPKLRRKRKVPRAPPKLPTESPLAREDSIAERVEFTKEMRTCDPAMFDALESHYLKEGHSREDSVYFAAFYTALKCHSQVSFAQIPD